MIILLWVQVCRARQPHIAGETFAKVASLPLEISEKHHIGSLPPEKGFWPRRRRPGSVDRELSQRDQEIRKPRTTAGRADVVLPISGRSFSGQSMRQTSLSVV
jgi:hypothetical protein